MKRSIYIILLFCGLHQIVFCQFTGGVADGYDQSTMENNINIYVGGLKDGYAMEVHSNALNIFRGGAKGGSSQIKLTNNQNIYSGGIKDGAQSVKLGSTISIFSGGNRDGHVQEKYNNVINIFSGGIEDGYTSKSKILSHLWTGAISQDWTLNGNWASGQIPTLTSNVVIPQNVPRFPLLMGGLLSLDQNPNNADYLCKRLKIRSGAEMTMDDNATLINYGRIEIDGIFRVENISSGSFTNESGGKVIVKTGGFLDVSMSL